jgi:hypothetical protein
MLRCAIERCKKKYSSPLPKSVLGERWSLALKQSGKSLGKSRLVMLKVSWGGGFVQSINHSSRLVGKFLEPWVLFSQMRRLTEATRIKIPAGMIESLEWRCHAAQPNGAAKSVLN